MQRISLLSAVGLLAIQSSLADSPLRTVTILWSPTHKSQAVSVEKETWLVAVAPPHDESFFETPRIEGHDASLTVLYQDNEQNLSLLESSQAIENMAPVSLSASKGMAPGEKLHCIAMSEACSSTIAGKDWAFRNQNFSAPLLRVRLSEQGKFCTPGTALLNQEGHLEGLLTPHHNEATGEAYAIPASRIQKLVYEFSNHHRSGPVWVGLVFGNNTSTPEVLAVKPNSPSSRAKFKKGDVILTVDDLAIEELDDLVEIFHTLPAGAEVKMTVLRGLEEKVLHITPQFASTLN